MTKANRIENECNRLVIKPLTKEERESIKAARKKSGMDRPTFYHDAVVDYAARINSEGGSNA